MCPVHVSLFLVLSVIYGGFGVAGTRYADRPSGTMDADLVRRTMDIIII